MQKDPHNSSVQVRDVSRFFGDVPAADRVSLDIRQGEFFSLLGPSGCGKTTLLRIVAGLEVADQGAVFICGQDMTRLPAYRRPVNMVFQHYALFPHLTLAENVAFGLRYKGVPRVEVSDRIARVLSLVRLSGLGERYPHQLSGGQRQRVALARALVLEPKVLLLDEPLAALDQRLRRDMQVELKALQRNLGITFIFVTHDQEEALILSDRVAVMNAGRVEQVDDAARIFECPQTLFVAEFMGASNFFSRNGLRFVVRPEKLALHSARPAQPEQPWMEVTIEQRVYQGINTVWIVCNAAGERFTVYEQNDQPFEEHGKFQVGGRAYLEWNRSHEVILKEPAI